MQDERPLVLRIEALLQRHRLEALQERAEELTRQAETDSRIPWPQPELTLIRGGDATETPTREASDPE